MSNNTDWLDELLENVFMVGVEHEKRTIPEIDKLQAKSKAAITKKLTQAKIDELEALEANSGCIEDGCSLDAELLRDNLLRRIRQLQATKENLG